MSLVSGCPTRRRLSRGVSVSPNGPDPAAQALVRLTADSWCEPRAEPSRNAAQGRWRRRGSPQLSTGRCAGQGNISSLQPFALSLALRAFWAPSRPSGRLLSPLHTPLAPEVFLPSPVSGSEAPESQRPPSANRHQSRRAIPPQAGLATYTMSASRSCHSCCVS